MELLINSKGEVRCLYGEAIDLRALGALSIQRASHVEPDSNGQWWADLAPSGGPRLGPFANRSDALQAEAIWLQEHLIAGEPQCITPALTFPFTTK
jgi:hypothetical protein